MKISEFLLVCCYLDPVIAFNYTIIDFIPISNAPSQFENFQNVPSLHRINIFNLITNWVKSDANPIALGTSEGL